MKHKFFVKISYILVLCSEISYFTLYSVDVRASESVNQILVSRSANNNSEVNRQPTIQKPQLPDRGIPTGRRRGGTSRNNCPILDKSLTALVPGKEAFKKLSPKYTNKKNEFKESKSFLTPTIREYPTFWVYVPKLTNSAQTGEFILQNEQGQDIYRSTINLPQKSGIIGIKYPGNSNNALKTGQKYHWYFKVYCGSSESNSGYLYVDAWIEKIALNSIDNKSLNINNYQIFIEKNLWYEAVDVLALEQLENIHKNKWDKLLGLLDLSDLINEKVLTL
jgi:hypothetical protein